ncbi:acyltransferase [Enterobacter hormaechei]
MELRNLQVIRAIAAMMVVLNHFWGPVFGWLFLGIGGMGVDIFFVLSGFLMVYTQNDSKGPIRFFCDRVRRIYPIYIIVSIPLILSTVPVIQHYNFVANFLLLPEINDYRARMANSPTWTLVYEMIFYVMFSFTLIFSRKKNFAAIFVSTIIVACIVAGDSLGLNSERRGWVNLGFILQDPLMVNFAAGCIYALIYPKLKGFISIKTPVFYIATFALLYIGLFTLSGNPRIISFGIPSFFIIVIATLSQNGKGIMSNFMHLIGDASYSIYISHIYFAHLLNDVINRNGNDKNVAIAMSFVLIIISVIVGIFIHKNIEKPSISWLKQKTRIRQEQIA